MLGQQQSITHLVSVIKHTEQEALRQAQRLLYSSHTQNDELPAREGCQASSRESSSTPRRPVTHKGVLHKVPSRQATPTPSTSRTPGPGTPARLAAPPELPLMLASQGCPPTSADTAPSGIPSPQQAAPPLDTEQSSPDSCPHAAPPTAMLSTTNPPNGRPHPPGTTVSAKQQPPAAHALHTVTIPDQTSAAARLQRAVAALKSMTPRQDGIAAPPAAAPIDPPPSAVVPKRLFPSPPPTTSTPQHLAREPIPSKEFPSSPLCPAAALPSTSPDLAPTPSWPPPGPADLLQLEGHPVPSKAPPPAPPPQISYNPPAAATHTPHTNAQGSLPSGHPPMWPGAPVWGASPAALSAADPRTVGPSALDPRTLGLSAPDPRALGPSAPDPRTLGPPALDPRILGPSAPVAVAAPFSSPWPQPGLDAAVALQAFPVPDGAQYSSYASAYNTHGLATAADTGSQLGQQALRLAMPAEACTSPRSEACMSYNAATGDLRFVSPLLGATSGQGFVATPALPLGHDGAQHIHVHLHQGPQQEPLHASSSWPASPQAYAAAAPNLPPPASTAPTSPATTSRHRKDVRDSTGSARLAHQIQELQAQLQQLVEATPRDRKSDAAALASTDTVVDRPVTASAKGRKLAADFTRASGRRRAATAPPPGSTENATGDDGSSSEASLVSLDDSAVQPKLDMDAYSARLQVDQLLKERQVQREREQVLEEQLKACKQCSAALEDELKASQMRASALEDERKTMQCTIDNQQTQLKDSEAGRQRVIEQTARDEAKLTMYRKQLGDAEGARTAAEKKLQASEAALEHQEHDLAETFQELKSLSGTYNTLVQEFSALQSDHKALQQNFKAAQEELTHCKGSLDALRADHTAVTAQSQEAQHRAALLDGEVERLRPLLEAANQEKRKLAADLGAAAEDLEEARQHVGTYKAKTDVQLVQLQTQCAKQQQELEGACSNLQAAHKEIEQHLQGFRSIQQDHQRLLVQHEKLQQDHLQLQHAHQSLQQKARQESQDAEAMINSLQADLQSVSKKMATAEAGVAALKDQCSSLDGLLQQELQRSSMLANDLARETAEAEKIPDLNKHIAALEEGLQQASLQLQAAKFHNAGLEQEVERYQKDLQHLRHSQLLHQQHQDTADVFHEHHLLSRVLCAWAASTKELILQRRVLDVALKRSKRKNLRLWIRRLRNAAIRSAAMRRIVNRHLQLLLRNALELLALHAAACRQKRQREQQGVQHWKQSHALKAMQAWQQEHARSRMQHAEPSPADAAAAVAHWQLRLRRQAWTCWRSSFLLHHQQPLLLMMKRAVKLRLRVLLTRSLQAWKQAVNSTSIKHQQVARAVQYRHTKLINLAWSAWLRHLAFQHDSRKLESTTQFFLAGRMVGAWHRVALQAKLAQQQVATCQHRRRRLLKVYALQAWHALLAGKQQAIISQQLAAEHRNTRLLRASMATWRLHWKLSMIQRSHQTEQAKGSLHRAAHQWLRFSTALTRWSQTKRMASMLWQRRQLQMLRACFQAWHRAVVILPQHREPLHKAVLGVCSRRFLQKALSAWYRQVVDASQQHLQELQDLTQSLQASCNDLQAQLAGSQEAKAQLASQLQVLEGQLTHSAQASKEEAMALQARLQEATLREEAAGAELEKLQARLVEAVAEQQAAQHQAVQQQQKLHEQAAQLQQQDDQIKDQQDQQAAQLADTHQKMLQLKVQLREHDELVQQLEDEGQVKVAALADAKLSREAVAAELSHQRVTADREMADLKQQLANMEATLADREDSISQMKQMLNAGDADLEAAQGQLSTMAKALSSQMKDRAERIALLEERIREVEAELTTNRSQHSLQMSDMQDELERARTTITKQQFVIKQAALFAPPSVGAATGQSPCQSPLYALHCIAAETPASQPGSTRASGDDHSQESEDFPITAFIAQQTAVLRG